MHLGARRGRTHTLVPRAGRYTPWCLQRVDTHLGARRGMEVSTSCSSTRWCPALPGPAFPMLAKTMALVPGPGPALRPFSAFPSRALQEGKPKGAKPLRGGSEREGRWAAEAWTGPWWEDHSGGSCRVFLSEGCVDVGFPRRRARSTELRHPAASGAGSPREANGGAERPAARVCLRQVGAGCGAPGEGRPGWEGPGYRGVGRPQSPVLGTCRSLPLGHQSCLQSRSQDPGADRTRQSISPPWDLGMERPWTGVSLRRGQPPAQAGQLRRAR